MRIWRASDFDGHPPGVSDGLASKCAYCGEPPPFDYQVTDRCWDEVVPPELSPGVICLSCLCRLAKPLGVDPHEHLREVQITGSQSTVMLAPSAVIRW